MESEYFRRNCWEASVDELAFISSSTVNVKIGDALHERTVLWMTLQHLTAGSTKYLPGESCLWVELTKGDIMNPVTEGRVISDLSKAADISSPTHTHTQINNKIKF